MDLTFYLARGFSGRGVVLVRRGVVVVLDLDRGWLTSRVRDLRLLGVVASKRGPRWYVSKLSKCGGKLVVFGG